MGIAETYQLTEEVGDTTIRNISNQRKKEERPCHRVQQSLFNLVQLEMLVANSLLVDAHPRDSQDPVFFLQPARVQLVIWDNPEEDAAQHDGQQTRYEEDDFPGFDGGAVFSCTDGDAVCDDAANDLADAVEAEPDVDAAALFSLCVPLQ